MRGGQYKRISPALAGSDVDGTATGRHNQGVAVESALNRGDRQPARNQLAAYIHQLQAQRSRTVSPQALATLKTDAEWLLAHLQ